LQHARRLPQSPSAQLQEQAPEPQRALQSVKYRGPSQNRDPSARHQPASKVPGGQAFFPSFTAQQNSV